MRHFCFYCSCKYVGVMVVNGRFELCSRFARHSALPSSENCWKLQQLSVENRHSSSSMPWSLPTPAILLPFFHFSLTEDMSCEMELKRVHLYLRRGFRVVNDRASGERGVVHIFGGSSSIACSFLHIFYRGVVVKSKCRRMRGGEVEWKAFV